MNRVFVALILIAFGFAAWDQLGVDLLGHVISEGDLGPMAATTDATMKAAKGAVYLSFDLIGYMALFLGLMKVGEAAGLLRIIARLLRPVMVRLFPEVPPEHPAMGAMILNMSANALGLGNAATPFGIRAMQELNKLNPHPGTATNSMVLFLAINTSAVTLLPTGVIGIRAAMSSGDPAGILGTTLFATLCSTSVALVMAKLLSRLSPMPPPPADWAPPDPNGADGERTLEDHGAYPIWVSIAAFVALLFWIYLALFYGSTIAPWVIPIIITGLAAFGWVRGVAVYEVFVQGAKEGFDVGIRIIPYLVAILSAVGMLRGAGAIDTFVGWVGPITSSLGMPAEALPMAMIRPLSGNGAFGVMMSILETHGPDSYIGYLVSTINGSTETTFYVLAVYFGAVQVQRTRHALPAALSADAAGIIGSVIAVQLYWSLL